MMIIRLHTLSAHAPSMQDAYKVVELMHMSDKDTLLLGEYHAEDLKLVWQQADFHLMLDAWVIVTREGQFAGYADVQQTCAKASKNFALALYIHPDYQRRGIETLLIRSGEERIHQICRSLATDGPIKVAISVSRGNHLLRDAVQYEGYSQVQQFLRMHIALEQMAHQTRGESDGLMILDVPLSATDKKNSFPDPKEAAAYTAKLYDVYEKMLECNIVNKKETVNVSALQDTTA